MTFSWPRLTWPAWEARQAGPRRRKMSATSTAGRGTGRAVAGKQPGLTGRHPSLLARDAPPVAQYLEKDGRENDIPILFALALFDPDDHPVTIDIGELERHDLRGS